MDDLQRLEAQGNESIERGDFSGARSAFEQAIQAAESKQSAEPRLLARLLNNAGFACRELGDYAAAEDYFHRSLHLYRQVGATDDPELAITLQHLGRMAHYRHDYEKSWQCWTDALSMWKRIVRDETTARYLPYLASCLHACGEHLADTGQYPAARRNLEQALALRESTLPPDHPDIAENLANLGRLCAFLGDRTAACSYLERAVPLYRTALGSDHDLVRELQAYLATVRGIGS